MQAAWLIIVHVLALVETQTGLYNIMCYYIMSVYIIHFMLKVSDDQELIKSEQKPCSQNLNGEKFTSPVKSRD